jgi:hypothetical protein
VPAQAARRVTSLGADSHPAVVAAGDGWALLVERQFVNPAQRDLVLARVVRNAEPSPTRTVYTTTAVSDRPESLRARFYRQCRDGQLHPFAWGVPPADVDGREAFFAVDFDAGSNPTQACPDGITRHEVSDGARRDHEDRGAASTDDRAPVVAVTSPAPGARYRQGQAVVVACQGRDAELGPLPPGALTAVVTGPQPAAGATGLVLVPPPGEYTVTCSATSGGVTTSAAATFRVLGPQLAAVADFDPDVLLVPPDPSESKTVTFIVTPPPGLPLDQVAPASVRLTSIAGTDVSGHDRFRAMEWSVVRTSGGGHQGVAKISRQAVAAFAVEHGLLGKATVALAGEAAAWGFAGDDDVLVRSR